jgi:hypothetical protein
LTEITAGRGELEPEQINEPTEPEPEPEPVDLTEFTFTGYTGSFPKAYKVGRLHFYALVHDSLVVVRGGDLFSEFEMFWFGFQVRDLKIDLSVPFASTDDGWRPFAPENSELQDAVRELICAAVNVSNVPVVLWREIASAYREGSQRITRLRDYERAFRGVKK